jgi:uncharacterized protein
MIVLDTTVLVYATGLEHPFLEPCHQLVGAITEGTVEATTTSEVIQEFMHVRARRRDRIEAAALARHFTRLLSPLLTVTRDHLIGGIEMFPHTHLGAFDAILAATAIAAGARALVSADRAFGSLPELQHVVPDAAGVAGLLS